MLHNISNFPVGLRRGRVGYKRRLTNNSIAYAVIKSYTFPTVIFTLIDRL